MIKSSLGRKDSFLFYSFEITTNHWKKSGQEFEARTGGRNWSRDRGGMLLARLLSLIFFNTPWAGTAPLTVSCTFPDQSSMKKMPHKLAVAYRAIWWTLSQLSSLFSDDFHLCRVDKTTQTQPGYFPVADINPTEDSLYYINHFYFWLNKSISCYTEWLSSSLLSRFLVCHPHWHFPLLSLQVSGYCLYNLPTVPRPHPLSPSPLSLSIKPIVCLAVLMQRLPTWLSIPLSTMPLPTSCWQSLCTAQTPT